MDYYPVLPNRMIQNMSLKQGFTFIDLLPGLQDTGKTDTGLYFPLNRHWTKAGHQKVAELLVIALNEP